MDEASRTPGKEEIHTKCLVGKYEGKAPLAKTRRRWEDNIKLYLKEIVFEGVNSTG
jgi:hypothetical protein